MKVINTNDDLDILLSPEEILKISWVKNPNYPGKTSSEIEERGRLEAIAINSPVTIGNPEKRIIIECGCLCYEVNGKRIESYQEGRAMVLRVHGLTGKLDDLHYNSGRPNAKPGTLDYEYNCHRLIQDRYDLYGNKATIWSTVNLPPHLKNLFRISVD